jgi:Homeodomain-like domain
VLQAHILLLLAEGYSWAVVAGVLFCSSRTTARWKSRVAMEGVRAVLKPSPLPGSRLGMERGRGPVGAGVDAAEFVAWRANLCSGAGHLFHDAVADAAS